jgi:predicted metallopeptidase
MDGFTRQGRARSSQQGFDFTSHVRRLCEDIALRCPAFEHLEMGRVAIRYCQVRSSVLHGVQATLTPLRFAGGATEEVRRGRTWTIRPLLGADGQELLYLLSFYLPRFLNRSFRDKLTTVIHELWHIGPRFDGDIRRHAGRCYAHGPRERQYDQQIERLTDDWLALNPPAELYEFLRYDFRDLVQLHGAVRGLRIPTPKLIRK